MHRDASRNGGVRHLSTVHSLAQKNEEGARFASEAEAYTGVLALMRDSERKLAVEGVTRELRRRHTASAARGN